MTGLATNRERVALGRLRAETDTLRWRQDRFEQGLTSQDHVDAAHDRVDAAMAAYLITVAVATATTPRSAA